LVFRVITILIPTTNVLALTKSAAVIAPQPRAAILITDTLNTGAFITELPWGTVLDLRFLGAFGCTIPLAATGNGVTILAGLTGGFGKEFRQVAADTGNTIEMHLVAVLSDGTVSPTGTGQTFARVPA
tara:strand:- start:241 stop:624 length:384 start_codon:yes stop_codon:yes gene_type:complete